MPVHSSILADLPMDSVFEEFSKGDFSKLEELAYNLTNEQRYEFAEFMVSFSEATENLRNLMEWVYRCEVEAAASPMMIFKTDTNMMSTILGNYLSYSPNCVRWLKFITSPLIQFLESQSVEANANSEVGVTILIRATEIALQHFFDSILDVPLWFRQAYIAYQIASDHKFGHTVAGDLLCGYLVNVLTTEKNVVIGDVSLKLRNGLRSVARLILQLGFQVGNLNNPLLQRFIEKKKIELVQYYNQFINLNNIALCEQILASSKPKFFARDVILRIKRNRFVKLIHTFQHPNSDFETNSNGSNESAETEVSQSEHISLLKKMDESEWKSIKNFKCGAKSYKLKNSEPYIHSLKIELRVKASLSDAVDYFTNRIFDPELDPYNSNIKKVGVSENLVHVWGFLELPWPIQPRCISFYQAEFLDHSKNQVVMVVKNAPYLGVKRKGMVSMTPFISGTRFTVDSKDPSYIKVTNVGHLDPGGRIPGWYLNRVALQEAQRFVKVKKMLENSKN